MSKVEGPNTFTGNWKDYKMFKRIRRDGIVYITGYNIKTKEQIRLFIYQKTKPSIEELDIPNSIAELNARYDRNGGKIQRNLWMRDYMRMSRMFGETRGDRGDPKKRFRDSKFKGKGGIGEKETKQIEAKMIKKDNQDRRRRARAEKRLSELKGKLTDRKISRAHYTGGDQYDDYMESIDDLEDIELTKKQKKEILPILNKIEQLRSKTSILRKGGLEDKDKDKYRKIIDEMKDLEKEVIEKSSRSDWRSYAGRKGAKRRFLKETIGGQRGYYGMFGPDISEEGMVVGNNERKELINNQYALKLYELNATMKKELDDAGYSTYNNSLDKILMKSTRQTLNYEKPEKTGFGSKSPIDVEDLEEKIKLMRGFEKLHKYENVYSYEGMSPEQLLRTGKDNKGAELSDRQIERIKRDIRLAKSYGKKLSVYKAEYIDTINQIKQNNEIAKRVKTKATSLVEKKVIENETKEIDFLSSDEGAKFQEIINTQPIRDPEVQKSIISLYKQYGLENLSEADMKHYRTIRRTLKDKKLEKYPVIAEEVTAAFEKYAQDLRVEGASSSFSTNYKKYKNFKEFLDKEGKTEGSKTTGPSRKGEYNKAYKKFFGVKDDRLMGYKLEDTGLSKKQFEKRRDEIKIGLKDYTVAKREVELIRDDLYRDRNDMEKINEKITGVEAGDREKARKKVESVRRQIAIDKKEIGYVKERAARNKRAASGRALTDLTQAQAIAVKRLEKNIEKLEESGEYNVALAILERRTGKSALTPNEQKFKDENERKQLRMDLLKKKFNIS